ncbi:peptidylprolyl isomerase [Chloroflexi bacterium TSY]|nr:peptidylprolyl isomerase [Chloroflexi bacterium TSY]
MSQLTLRDPGASPDFAGDKILTILIEESETSELPTPTPPPPTPTPTVTPTPYAPTSLEGDRPLAQISAAERSNFFNAAPDLVIDPAQSYTAIISTSQGNMTVELAADEAPLAVNNFVVIANLGFYDGLPVNQVTPGQFVVIGSPDNTPANDIGYAHDAETGTDLALAAGMVGYIPVQNAPSDPVRSSGSQLLFTLIAPPANVTQDLSFFGQITEGIEVLEQLTAEDTIESITIEEGE